MAPLPPPPPAPRDDVRRGRKRKRRRPARGGGGGGRRRRHVHPRRAGAARRAAAARRGGRRPAQAARAQPGLGAARRPLHHGAVHGAGRARLAPHPRRHLRPPGARRRRRPRLRRPRAAPRLLHEPADGLAAPGHRRLLLPGHHLQPLGFPAGRFWAQAPRVKDHSPLRFRSHPHSAAVRHRDRLLLLGLGADPRAAAAAQEVPRLPGLRHLRRELLPGGRSRRSLHPRHRRQPAAPLSHRGRGAGLGAPVRDGGERTLPGRVRSDQPVPAAAGLHPLMLPRAVGHGNSFLPAPNCPRPGTRSPARGGPSPVLHFLGTFFTVLVSSAQRKELVLRVG